MKNYIENTSRASSGNSFDLHMILLSLLMLQNEPTRGHFCCRYTNIPIDVLIKRKLKN